MAPYYDLAFQSRGRIPRVLFLPAVRRRKQPLHGASQRRHVHAMRVSERHCKCYYQTSWVNHEKEGGPACLSDLFGTRIWDE